jgi:hypothetical protein
MILYTPRSKWQYSPEDGGSKVLQNVGIPPHNCMASQSRRRWFKSTCGKVLRALKFQQDCWVGVIVFREGVLSGGAYHECSSRNSLCMYWGALPPTKFTWSEYHFHLFLSRQVCGRGSSVLSNCTNAWQSHKIILHGLKTFSQYSDKAVGLITWVWSLAGAGPIHPPI